MGAANPVIILQKSPPNIYLYIYIHFHIPAPKPSSPNIYLPEYIILTTLKLAHYAIRAALPMVSYAYT